VTGRGVSATITTPPGAIILGSDFKALAAVRSLGRRGIPCVIIDGLPRSAWFSRYVVRRVRWRGAMWGSAFVEFLLDLGAAGGLRDWVLLPMQDEVVELVARNRPSLASAFRVVTQDWEIIKWAHDKRLVHQIANDLGIPYPRTWYPTSVSDLLQMKFPYPLIVKPAFSIQLQYAVGGKVFPASSKDELIDQYRRASAIIDPGEIMVQEVIPGDGRTQLSVAAYCKQGTLLNGMTARRRRQFPVDYGLSSTFVEAVEIPGLMQTTERLLRRMGLSGPVEVEFKHDARDGRDKLLDVNPRLWGWHDLCRACGLDFAYMQYRDAFEEIPSRMSPVYGPRWRRLLTDVAAAVQEIRLGRLTVQAYLGSLRGPSVAAVLDLRDPVPAFGDVIIAVLRLLKRDSGGHARIEIRGLSRPPGGSDHCELPTESLPSDSEAGASGRCFPGGSARSSG
jgi:D-aspartate ligase